MGRTRVGLSQPREDFAHRDQPTASDAHRRSLNVPQQTYDRRHGIKARQLGGYGFGKGCRLEHCYVFGAVIDAKLEQP